LAPSISRTLRTSTLESSLASLLLLDISASFALQAFLSAYEAVLRQPLFHSSTPLNSGNKF
jgi:hypothetical protein